MRRFLFLTHRYLGIGLGLIMALWCLSGFVMMYMPYPEVSKVESLHGSAPLDLSRRCCDTGGVPALGLVDVNRFVVEMMGDRPVLRIRASGRQNPIVDLSNGAPVRGVDHELAGAIATRFAANFSLEGPLRPSGLVAQDQWTVTSFFDYHRPLHHFSVEDARGTHFYVSSTTGEVVQMSTTRERFWNWLGAIPHWLYPTALRQHEGLWAQLVIWLSLGGVFLTAVGIYVGLKQYRTLRSGRKSPYRGVALWHHYTGLLFGLFVLTWVSSGLFSMNPWNLFDLSGGGAERQRLQGVPLFSTDMEDFAQRMPEGQWPEGTVRLEGYALQGRLAVLAYQADGHYQRYDGRTLLPWAMDEGELSQLGQVAAGGARIAAAELLEREDAYYYSHKHRRELPVYRIILDNDDRTRIYINAVSGELAAQFDRPKRAYRWLFSGLHQLDLAAVIRMRPVWDLLVWILLIGVSLSTLTGVYMGAKRLLGRSGGAAPLKQNCGPSPAKGGQQNTAEHEHFVNR